MRCPQCRHDNPDAARFCGDCGAPIEALCPSCKTANPPGNKFCHQCGTALGGATSSEKAAPVPVEAAPRAYTPRHLADKILASRSAVDAVAQELVDRALVVTITQRATCWTGSWSGPDEPGLRRGIDLVRRPGDRRRTQAGGDELTPAQRAERAAGEHAKAGMTSRANRRSDSRPPALLTSTCSAPTSLSASSLAAISSGVP